MPQLNIWITYFFHGTQHKQNRMFFFSNEALFSVKNWIMCSKTKAQKFLIYRFFKIVGNTCFQWWDVRTYVRVWYPLLENETFMQKAKKAAGNLVGSELQNF